MKIIKKYIPVIIKQMMKDVYYDIRNFNIEIFIFRACFTLSGASGKWRKRKDHAIMKYLKKKYRYVIDKYRNAEEISQKQDTEKSPVWILWWQGTEQMPDIIRMCLYSKINNAGSHPVVVLTKDNIKQYVELPDYIWEQFENGQLMIQHLADIIRVCLIEKWGGLWLDASVFCSEKIPEWVFQQPVYSLKCKESDEFVSQNRWTTFVIGGCKGNVLCRFLKDFFFEYCRDGKRFIDYYLFDIAIALAYENIYSVAVEIDQLPVILGSFYWLNDNICKNASDALISEFSKQDLIFHKMSWRDVVSNKDTNDNRNSLYYYLRRNEERKINEKGEHYYTGL